MFENITIIGCGLIGSSLLRALNKKKISKKITIYDKSKEVLSYLRQENLSVDISSDICASVKEADIIIIATPLSSYKEILLSIKDNLKKGSILTDTGSSKKEINKIIENLNLKNVSWIASHPIAGTENSGPKAGYAELFENRWCVISPSSNAKKEEVEKIEILWKKIGSKVKLMSFHEHDHILSLTSHLPHAIAFNIVRTAINDEDRFKKEIIQYSAGGLRDFTRIAPSDPLMWKDIMMANEKHIIESIEMFKDSLERLLFLIKDKDDKELLSFFSSVKKSRDSLL